MNHSPYIVTIMVLSAAISFVSFALARKVNKKYEQDIKQPYERQFFFSKEQILRKIRNCTDPVFLDNLEDEIDNFLNFNWEMIDEVNYAQTILDISGALQEKRKSFTSKS